MLVVCVPSYDLTLTFWFYPYRKIAYRNHKTKTKIKTKNVLKVTSTNADTKNLIVPNRRTRSRSHKWIIRH